VSLADTQRVVDGFLCSIRKRGKVKNWSKHSQGVPIFILKGQSQGHWSQKPKKCRIDALYYRKDASFGAHDKNLIDPYYQRQKM